MCVCVSTCAYESGDLCILVCVCVREANADLFAQRRCLSNIVETLVFALIAYFPWKHAA